MAFACSCLASDQDMFFLKPCFSGASRSPLGFYEMRLLFRWTDRHSAKRGLTIALASAKLNIRDYEVCASEMGFSVSACRQKALTYERRGAEPSIPAATVKTLVPTRRFEANRKGASSEL